MKNQRGLRNKIFKQFVSTKIIIVVISYENCVIENSYSLQKLSPVFLGACSAKNKGLNIKLYSTRVIEKRRL